MNKISTTTIRNAKEKFTAAFPGVKCKYNKDLLVPAFIYQDGPAIQEAEILLAEFGVRVVRYVNANLLGRTAAKFLNKYVNADNSFATRGFTKGYITPDGLCTAEEAEAARNYAQGLSAAAMQAIIG